MRWGSVCVCERVGEVCIGEDVRTDPTGTGFSKTEGSSERNVGLE